MRKPKLQLASEKISNMLQHSPYAVITQLSLKYRAYLLHEEFEIRI
jgi:hypothetical protein